MFNSLKLTFSSLSRLTTYEIASTYCDLAECNESRKYLRSVRYRPVDNPPPALYGGRHIVTMLPGNGIGPEMMNYVREIFAFINAPVDFEIVNVENRKEDVKNAITSTRRNGCCIKGNIENIENLQESEVGMELYISPNVAIRKKLDLFASLNVCKSYKNVVCKFKDLDLVVIRQNTEGEYSMIEHETKAGVVEMMKIVTRGNSERIAQWAVEYAKFNNRKKITIVHNASIMTLSDGLFLTTTRNVLKENSDLIVDDVIIDNLCNKLTMDPYQFDILLCPNLYGTIICNMVCGLTGGAGLTSGCNFGTNYAAFEPATRSTGSPLVGKNIANPIAMLNSSVDLLNYLGRKGHADLICKAIKQTVEVDNVLTEDIGGFASTSEVIAKIKENLRIMLPS